MPISTSGRYGRRLLPQIADDLASAEPTRIVYSIARSSDISQPLLPVSARAFANAVNKTAWWLQEQIGTSTKIQPVGYIGPHDLRHIILTYACAKANCTALFLSPKNSTEGAVSVLRASDCRIWVRPQEMPASLLLQDVLQQHDMRVLELPQLDELLDAATVESFPYEKTFENAVQEPFCLLHTSGSTGLPKPIPWSHGLIGTMDAIRLLPPTEGDDGLLPWTTDWKDGDRIYSTFPMSHGAGIIMNLLMPALFRLHCIMGPAHVIPNISLIDSLAQHGKIDIWSMIPSIVDELGETPEVLEKFGSSKFICASGGPVSPISACKVNDVIRVLNLTGLTEGLFIGNLVTAREDWLYFAFHPHAGFEFKQVEPGVYEHWIHRNEHWDLFQGYFHTFPELQTVNTKDLYVQHPKNPNLWAYKGRNDDVIVLSNGYKISPLDTEALVTTHPAIDGCLMIGSGKSQAGLLIELKDPAAPRNFDLFESIWALVERANSLSLHKNQLHKDFIVFTDANKPFIRTDKRTVKRKATIELYTEFIESFYAVRQEHSDPDLEVSISTDSIESITNGVSQILVSLSPLFNGTKPDDDLFYVGMDSLVLVQVIKYVRAATGLDFHLAPKHLYENPTIAQFAAVVAQIATQIKKTEENSTQEHETDIEDEDEFARLRKMLQKHDARLTQKMNPFDMMNANHYIGMLFYLPLAEGVDFQKAYSILQDGLKRTIEMIPALEGKLMACSEQELGYKRGSRCITCPPPRSTARPNDATDSSTEPKQLRYKDLSSVLPSFETLQKDGFVPGRYRDETFNDTPTNPPLPADVFTAQANFVTGGCVLATRIHHQCADGNGAITIVQAWAENCRYVAGDKSAKCEWLHPESLNHSLPYAIYEQEGYARPAHEIGPEVWKNFAFDKPAELKKENEEVIVPSQPIIMTGEGNSDPLAIYKSKDGRVLESKTFLIPPDSVEKLRQEVAADPANQGAVTSIIDIIQAFYWRSALRARYRAAKEYRGESFGPDDKAILEMPINARGRFSSLLPASYIGSFYVMNRVPLPVEELCSPNTSVARIAQIIHDAARSFTPSMVHDIFTLLQTVTDYDINSSVLRGLSGMNVMVNNMILFQTSEIQFGKGLFGNGGSPEAMRIQSDLINSVLRMIFIYPMRPDGSIELTLGTFPEEFQALIEDEEFMKYAKFVGGSFTATSEDMSNLWVRALNKSTYP